MDDGSLRHGVVTGRASLLHRLPLEKGLLRGTVRVVAGRAPARLKRPMGNGRLGEGLAQAVMTGKTQLRLGFKEREAVLSIRTDLLIDMADGTHPDGHGAMERLAARDLLMARHAAVGGGGTGERNGRGEQSHGQRCDYHVSIS